MPHQWPALCKAGEVGLACSPVQGGFGVLCDLQVATGVVLWIPQQAPLLVCSGSGVPSLTSSFRGAALPSCEKNVFLLSDEAWHALYPLELQGRMNSLVEMMSVELLL